MQYHVPGFGPVGSPDERFSVGLVPVGGGVLPLGLASEGGEPAPAPAPEPPSEPEDGDPLSPELPAGEPEDGDSLSPEVPAGGGGGFSLGLTSVAGGVLSSGVV